MLVWRTRRVCICDARPPGFVVVLRDTVSSQDGKTLWKIRKSRKLTYTQFFGKYRSKKQLLYIELYRDRAIVQGWIVGSGFWRKNIFAFGYLIVNYCHFEFLWLFNGLEDFMVFWIFFFFKISNFIPFHNKVCQYIIMPR